MLQERGSNVLSDLSCMSHAWGGVAPSSAELYSSNQIPERINIAHDVGDRSQVPVPDVKCTPRPRPM